MLFTVVGIAVGAVVLQAITRRTFLVLSGRIGQDILFEIRRRVYRHFQKLSPAFHDDYTSGRVISRQTSDMDAIYEMLETGFDGLVTAVLTLLGTGVLLLVLDLKLGLVALLCFPFLMWLTNWFRRESAATYRVTREKVALVIVHFVESMGGIRAVQAFRREPRNQEIFDDVNDQYRLANLRAFRLVAWFMPGIKLIGNVTIAVVLVYGAYLAHDGEITVGVLAAFLLYLRAVLRADAGDLAVLQHLPVGDGRAGEAVRRARGGADGGGAGRPGADAARARRGAASTRSASSTSTACRCCRGWTSPSRPARPWRWSARRAPARPRSPSCSRGSTTRATGRVLLDGVSLRDLDEPTLRRSVVMVTQENYLFGGTVADNIRFGKPSASIEEVHEAARAIGAHDFITRLPEGYDTDVANRGGRLSAGQRQLVAFARAFLADPDVLILDEATSSLDVPSERLVQHALRTILRERTAVIIAHRLSTVEIADRVLVLEHGRIVEDGAPADLIAGGEGRFSDLHDAWLDSLA